MYMVVIGLTYADYQILNILQTCFQLDFDIFLIINLFSEMDFMTDSINNNVISTSYTHKEWNIT